MSLIPIILMNDGREVRIARVHDDGKVDAAITDTIDVDGISGRFASTDELIIEDLSVKPRVPLKVAGQSVERLVSSVPSDGYYTYALSSDLAYAHSLTDPVIYIWSGDEWTPMDAPEGFTPQAMYRTRDALRIVGTRGYRPSIISIDPPSEIRLHRRWLSSHAGNGGPMMSVAVSRLGEVVVQDDGHFDRQVVTVYLESAKGWHRGHAGNSGVARVDDPESSLPPILLHNGRWMEPHGKKLKQLPPLVLANQALPSSRSRFRRQIWSGACVVNDVVTALVSILPESRSFLLRGRLGEPLDRIAEFESPAPHSIRLFEEKRLVWP